MFLAKLLGRVRRAVGSAAADPLDELPPADQFRRFLERERSRATRTGDRFTVIAFAARGGFEERRTSLSRLVAILRKRLRFTDEVGWLDAEQICALLPGTPAAGAWKLADEVCLEFTDKVMPPACTVYAYPAGNAEAVEPSADGPGQPVFALDALFAHALPAWKRCLDVVGAVTGLIVLAPVFLAIAAAVKLTSRGPVLFRQLRTGRGGKPFVIYKFRTMFAGAETLRDELRDQNEQDGPAFKIRNDPRVTLLGRLLRKTSLDELPQLWNVLTGDMSLVGPRPLPCAESGGCADWQRRRLDVTPGLTCIWQVRGRSRVTFADWMRMDMEYIRKRSFWQDLKLLLLTVPAVLLRRGAH